MLSVKRTHKLFFLLLLFPLLAWGSSQEGNLDQRVREIADQLRCPVCRGVPISESPSAMAVDMMQAVRQQLEQGRTETEILNYFESRYGEWILLNPKPKGLNLMIWILPLLLLLGGGAFILFKVRRWSARS